MKHMSIRQIPSHAGEAETASYGLAFIVVLPVGSYGCL